jgi:hypothetical protein
MGFDQFIMSISTFVLTNSNFKDLNKLTPFTLIANKYLIMKKNNLAGLQNSFLHVLKYTDDGLTEVGW